MNSMLVVIVLESGQLSLQVSSVPERQTIKIFFSNGISTQSLWKSLVTNGGIKQAVEGDAIDIPGMHTKSYNAS